MLIMWRHEGETILVGERVEIRLEEIRASRVKLAISAPASVKVVCKELELTRRQNLAASRGPAHEQILNAIKKIRSSQPNSADKVS